MDSRPNLRKEKRIPIRLTMRLLGTTDKGVELDLEIVTENVSREGLCFRFRQEIAVQPGDRIIGSLKSPQVQTEFALEVRWRKGDMLGGRLEYLPQKWLVR